MRSTIAERRTYVRVPFMKAVELTVHVANQTVEARTIDISLGGVGIITQGGVIVAGQFVTVAFRLHDARLGVRVERVAGRVANFRADLDGNRVGVEFMAPLNEAEYPALVRAVEQL